MPIMFRWCVGRGVSSMDRNFILKAKCEELSISGDINILMSPFNRFDDKNMKSYLTHFQTLTSQGESLVLITPVKSIPVHTHNILLNNAGF